MKSNLKPKVFVAMSGGVDSSVAAALLQKRGFKVVGVFFKPWSPPPTVNGQTSSANRCQWQQDRLDAMQVAAILRIPFKTWDFSDQYGRKVANYMINGYRRGITPNPDVMCNKEIKFGLFLKKALAEGADYIATGHYARVKAISFRQKAVSKNGPKSLKPTAYSLLQAIDKNKDQTYFLWTLTQRQLRCCLFPIGDYTKPQVRTLAKKFGLPNHDKKDSQGVCFIGELDMKDFLKNYIRPRPGEIKLAESGRTIGIHDGVYYYTIGQRHGLNITNGDGPYFVSGKDSVRNIIYVTKLTTTLRGRQAVVKDLNWFIDRPLPIAASVKIRYKTKAVPAEVIRNGSLKTALIKFRQPARAIAPGQSAVFYRGQQVLGGGVIV